MTTVRGSSTTPPDAGRDALRTAIRAQRRALDAPALADADAALTRRLLPLLAGTARVAGYLAIHGEAPLGGTLAALRAAGTLTAVPRVTGDALAFHSIDDDTAMRPGPFGIAEPVIPDNDEALDPMHFDAILVPLVAFDDRGNRIGMGGGYYDRCLAPVAARRRGTLHTPRLIGVAHAFQQVDRLVPESWDVPMDLVVTDAGVVHAGPR